MKKNSVLRAISVVVPKGVESTVVNTLRYTLHELATIHGDKSIPAFERATGLTTKALLSPFGLTFYYANTKERKEALKTLMKCMPAALVGKVEVTKRYRKTSAKNFKKNVHTFKARAA